MQLENAHDTLENTFGDLSVADAHREPGGRAFKPAANYAHVIFAEDGIVNGMIRHGAPLFASSWAGRTGFSAPMPMPGQGDWAQTHDAWSRSVTMDMAQARQYARAVEADALEYISSLKPEDLDQPVEVGIPGVPSMPLGMMITAFIIGHFYSLAGELSAGKGVLGLQGYPF
jgi:hypothetical protein